MNSSVLHIAEGVQLPAAAGNDADEDWFFLFVNAQHNKVGIMMVMWRSTWSRSSASNETSQKGHGRTRDT